MIFPWKRNWANNFITSPDRIHHLEFPKKSQNSCLWSIIFYLDKNMIRTPWQPTKQWLITIRRKQWLITIRRTLWQPTKTIKQDKQVSMVPMLRKRRFSLGLPKVLAKANLAVANDGIRLFPFGALPIFRGENVSFRELLSQVGNLTVFFLVPSEGRTERLHLNTSFRVNFFCCEKVKIYSRLRAWRWWKFQKFQEGPKDQSFSFFGWLFREDREDDAVDW